jgi:hypothetical protein
MKRIVCFLTIFLLAGAGAVLAAEAPVAAVPEPVHEFAPVLDGDEVVHDFVIRNTGTATLEIPKINTG